jgi:hypothetical protein
MDYETVKVSVHFVDDDDEDLGKIAMKRYQEEKHLAVNVSLDDL